MIRDLLLEQDGSEHRSQVCVVGAGAAGITLAVMLRRAGMQVTMLEGGGTVRSGSDAFQAGVSGLPYRGIHEGRAQILGGTTTLWGGQILPLDELDFESRAWVPGSGWPWRKADLLPFYRTALTMEGLSHTVESDDQVWNKLGLQRPAFASLESYLSRWCPEPNFAVLHRRALQQQDIRVWLNARAVRMCHSGESVTGVVACTPSGKQHTFRADRFIFCLGAIESCRFFLQPQEGTLPWNRSGLLGRHFQDHVDCDAATILPRDAGALSEAFDAIYLRGQKYLPKLRLSAPEQRARCLLNVGATVYTPQHEDTTQQVRSLVRSLLRGKVPDGGFAASMRSLAAAPAFVRQGLRYVTHRRGSLRTRVPLRLRVHCEQEPCGNSTIRLRPERDQFGMQQADVHWVISDRELDTIRGFTRMVANALQPIAHVEPHPDLFHTAADFRTSCQDSFHHMGGMRMHASPRLGVVDTDLRLHGTANCYVCSAAIFPTSGFSNPTHTLLALTVRLAESLAR